MTDYIEEMMKTAGILGDSICSNCDRNAPDDTLGLCCNGCMSIDKEIYPSFTAEKQLELIKLIIKTHVLRLRGENPILMNTTLIKNEIIAGNGSLDEDFTQALAQLTTELMNAGELDKEKVKEILENAR